MNPTNAQDSAYYLYATSALAEVLSFTTDYEGVLRVALPVIEQLKDQNAGYSSTLGDLMINVGFAQMSLRMKEDAAESFDGFYDIAMKNYAAKPSWQNLSFYFTSAFNIFQEYARLEDFETAKKWLAREDSLIAIIIEREDIPAMPKDQLMSYYYISQGFMAVGLKQATELARAIADYQKTDFSKTVGGRISEASLLFEAERYGEAADDLAVLDQYLAEREMELSLDNISNFYGYKFKANNNAGRRDSALTVASFIVEHLDSAIAKEKRSQTAELATIYETQQKDAEIAKQQISLSRQRWISTLAALVLLTTFFIIYTWYRRRAQKRLSVAHEQLKTAYDQLEETTAAKERIESELRIARDIQMSMVPNNFPEHERLDMYAEMNPAKEVGGQFYGSTQLGFLRTFGDQNQTQFMTVPTSVGYKQELLFYNPSKWEKKIEPMKLQAAEKTLAYGIESASEEAVNKFFTLALAQDQQRMAEEYLASCDTIYAIAQRRFKIASISKAELSILELEKTNARTSLANARIARQRAAQELAVYLGMERTTDIELIIPSIVQTLQIDATEAIQYARENNPNYLNSREAVIEARRDAERARVEKNFSMSLDVSLGLNQVANRFVDAYRNLQSQDMATITLSIPLKDWGKRKNAWLAARSNMEAAERSEQETARDTELDVAQTVAEFNERQSIVETASLALTIAENAYSQTLQRFIKAQADAYSLSIAQSHWQTARQNQIASLQNYWLAYYHLRRLTLYDYLHRRIITPFGS